MHTNHTILSKVMHSSKVVVGKSPPFNVSNCADVNVAYTGCANENGTIC